MILLSKKIQQLEESATLAMARKSRELQENGKKIINLSLGEPAIRNMTKSNHRIKWSPYIWIIC